eukprot:TRINITY_DN15518_c0_g1_i1.p1 TRINITY_DN15518_c0_g1~~TRINITY_DN15518_c0_g1_i1.p1  ORF type:complete len:400 (+),score=34.25 TRINITY_DN15518_c0_g1_i1:601-1800(+)
MEARSSLPLKDSCLLGSWPKASSCVHEGQRRRLFIRSNQSDSSFQLSVQSRRSIQNEFKVPSPRQIAGCCPDRHSGRTSARAFRRSVIIALANLSLVLPNVSSAKAFSNPRPTVAAFGFFKDFGNTLSNTMSLNLREQHWNDLTSPADMASMWSRADVSMEWRSRGVQRGGLVPFTVLYGQPILTKTELRAVAEIVLSRYFPGRRRPLDPAMVCAVGEVESSRRPLAYRFEPSRQEASTGLMQVLQSTGEWLATSMGYRAYTVDWASTPLYQPFASVYYGCAYLNWLSTYAGRDRSEEFIARGYNGGPGGADKPSTLNYWDKYQKAKQMYMVSASLLSQPLATPSAPPFQPPPPPVTPPPRRQSTPPPPPPRPPPQTSSGSEPVTRKKGRFLGKFDAPR